MSSRKETIRISFGPSANAISSHLSNLEGLASTSILYGDDAYDDANAPLCDVNVTHRSVRYSATNGSSSSSTSSNRHVYVSRGLFIDTQDGFSGDNSHSRWQPKQQQHQYDLTANDETNVSTWGGKVQVYNPREQRIDQEWNEIKEMDVMNDQMMQTQITGGDNNHHQGQQHQKHSFDLFHAASETLSQHTNRFDRPVTETHQSQSSNSRYMNWDDLEEEEEEEDYDQEYDDEYREYQTKLKQQQKSKQKAQQIHHSSNQAAALWKQAYSNSLYNVGWYDYLLPPLPPLNPSMLSLPLFAHKTEALSPYPEWDSYITGYQNNDSISTKWREDVLSEKLRCLLEETDALGGFQLALDGCGMGVYSGLGTFLLEEIHDECRSAKTFSILAFNDDETQQNQEASLVDSRMMALMSFRKQMNYTLSLHGISSHSSLTLPMNLSQCGKALFPGSSNDEKGDSNTGDNNISEEDNTKSDEQVLKMDSTASPIKNTPTLSEFQLAASAALALECATLPYRLASSPSSHSASPSIAMAGSSIVADPYATADRLAFSDFVASLKPGNRHSLLSIDGCLGSHHFIEKDKDLKHALFQGIQQEDNNDSRMRQQMVSPKVYPGTWMKDDTFSSLSSTSKTNTKKNIKEAAIQHDYFAVGTSIRPPTQTLMSILSSPPASSAASLFAQPLIQGLIYRGRSPHEIRSLPDRISTCVVPSSVSYLTHCGCYWDSIWEQSNAKQRDPISWTILSNSTKSYESIQTQTTQMTNALKGSPAYYSSSARNNREQRQNTQQWRAFMKQDMQMNKLPEEEDCLEILEYFNDLSSIYLPYGMDDEDDYLDLED